MYDLRQQPLVSRQLVQVAHANRSLLDDTKQVAGVEDVECMQLPMRFETESAVAPCCTMPVLVVVEAEAAIFIY